MLLLLLAAPGAAQAPECEAAVQGAQWQRAITACEAALAGAPDSFGIRYFLGYAHQAAGNWAEAAAAFEAFLEAEAELGERMAEQVEFAVRSAGLAHARAGETGRAIRWLRRADGTDPEVAFWLGFALQDTEPAQAEAALRVVVEAAPEIAEARFLLGRLRHRAGDGDEAQALLTGYLAADPEGNFASEAHWLLARSALQEDEGSDRAAVHFEGFLATGGDGSRSAAAHYFLGDRAAAADDCEAASGHYRRFVELTPDDPRVDEVRAYLDGCQPPPVC